MGILDEAIKEHLDLKRSRGADPAEVTRQEHEALGPVRREPAADAVPDEAAPEAAAPEAEPVPPAAEAPPLAPPPAREPEVAVPFDSAAEPEPEPVPVEPARAEPEPEPEPEPEAAAPVPAPPTTGPQETEEWGFEDAVPAAPAEPPPAEEDVLEETPDFLQETPEHDRLWFEQKPPRDFDFDG